MTCRLHKLFGLFFIPADGRAKSAQQLISTMLPFHPPIFSMHPPNQLMIIKYSTERHQKCHFPNPPTQSVCWRNIRMFSYMTYLFENNLCKYVRVICKTQSNIWVVHLQCELKLIDLDFRPHWKKRVGTYNLMGHFNHCDRELILATPTFPILKKYLRLLGRAMNVSAFRPNQRHA